MGPGSWVHAHRRITERQLEPHRYREFICERRPEQSHLYPNSQSSTSCAVIASLFHTLLQVGSNTGPAHGDHLTISSPYSNPPQPLLLNLWLSIRRLCMQDSICSFTPEASSFWKSHLTSCKTLFGSRFSRGKQGKPGFPHLAASSWGCRDATLVKATIGMQGFAP